jgi:hypothetical protein
VRGWRRNILVVARAPNTRNSNVVSVDLKSKVLESVAVADGLSRVGLGKIKDARVIVIAIVFNNTLPNLGNVK